MLSQPRWLDSLVEIGTYILTLYLIWWEKNRLLLSHIDALAIVIILFIKPLQTLLLAITRYGSILAFPNYPSLVTWVGAATLFQTVRSKHPDLLRVQEASRQWFGIGASTSTGQALLLGYPMASQANIGLLGREPHLFTEPSLILPFFLAQLSSAAIIEGPSFGGCPWGQLRKTGRSEWRIWLFQALIFALDHIYYLRQDGRTSPQDSLRSRHPLSH
jgi:hypothetical protein